MRPALVYMSCANISHNYMRKYRKKIIQCVICASKYKVENYKCEITKCITKVSKICTYVTIKYINCGENY